MPDFKAAKIADAGEGSCEEGAAAILDALAILHTDLTVASEIAQRMCQLLLQSMHVVPDAGSQACEQHIIDLQTIQTGLVALSVTCDEGQQLISACSRRLLSTGASDLAAHKSGTHPGTGRRRDCEQSWLHTNEEHTQEQGVDQSVENLLSEPVKVGRFAEYSNKTENRADDEELSGLLRFRLCQLQGLMKSDDVIEGERQREREEKLDANHGTHKLQIGSVSQRHFSGRLCARARASVRVFVLLCYLCKRTYLLT